MAEFKITPCLCNICGWAGSQWSDVMAKPGVFVHKQCPDCLSYPRDRIVYDVLNAFILLNQDPPSVLEFGCSAHSYDWKSKLCPYANADITDKNAPIDFLIKGNVVDIGDKLFNIAILSFVLSMVPERADRIMLLTALNQSIHANGFLVFFDDIDLKRPDNLSVKNDDYFHKIRFGNELLKEFIETGWLLKTITIHPISKHILAEIDTPYFIAYKTARDA